MGYPEDIINAFTGIQTALGRMFSCTFAAGLPIPLLDLALLWTPVETVKCRITVSQHPSWSWSGWIGQVHYKDLVHPMAHLPISKLFEPLATWNVGTLGIIKFDCESVKMTAFAIQKPDKRLINPQAHTLVTRDTYYIIDDSNQRCGMLLGIPEGINLLQGAEPVELLRLSRWKRVNAMNTHGRTISHLLDSGNTEEENLFHENLRDTEWCTYNVMLVRWSGPGYQRVAVGQMHRDAWNTAGPLMKAIAVQ